MEEVQLKQLIDKEKWSEFLKRFIEVLRINIFIVDASGHVLIPSPHHGDRGCYGSRFLKTTFGFDPAQKEASLLKSFERSGAYLETKDPFDFHAYAVPIRIEGEKTIAYLIVGPVILNKRWANEEYLSMAQRLGMNADDLIDMIYEIRVVSHLTMRAILDLLAEVAKDIVELNIEKRRLTEVRQHTEVISKEMVDAAQDICSTIHLDELLITILDVALNLSDAESGSIMILDEERGDLEIKVARGLGEETLRQARQKLGEGIAGIAAQENMPFIISGTQGDNRIRHLLKRPEIRQSAVIPLTVKDRVFGVLNLHTKKEDGKIVHSVDNLKHFSKLISTAVGSI